MSNIHIDLPVTKDVIAKTMQGVALGYPWVQIGPVVLRGEGVPRAQLAAFFVHIGKTMLDTPEKPPLTLEEIATTVQVARDVWNNHNPPAA